VGRLGVIKWQEDVFCIENLPSALRECVWEGVRESVRERESVCVCVCVCVCVRDECVCIIVRDVYNERMGTNSFSQS
jgi:hypothetical protein